MTNSAWPPPAWFITGCYGVLLALLVVLIFFLLQRMLGTELKHLLHLVLSERNDSKAGKSTVGAINWNGFLTGVSFGIGMVVLASFQKIAGFLGKAMSVEKANDLISYTNYLAVFYVMIGFLVFSMIMVHFDAKDRRAKSRKNGKSGSYSN